MAADSRQSHHTHRPSPDRSFNMISHSNLLNQLISIGLSRIQTAQLKNYQFQLFPSACGVPQDSVLGCLLFIICCHLITSSVITVAEDTQLYLSCKPGFTLHLHQLTHAPLSARYQNLGFSQLSQTQWKWDRISHHIAVQHYLPNKIILTCFILVYGECTRNACKYLIFLASTWNHWISVFLPVLPIKCVT